MQGKTGASTGRNPRVAPGVQRYPTTCSCTNAFLEFQSLHIIWSVFTSAEKQTHSDHGTWEITSLPLTLTTLPNRTPLGYLPVTWRRFRSEVLRDEELSVTDTCWPNDTSFRAWNETCEKPRNDTNLHSALRLHIPHGCSEENPSENQIWTEKWRTFLSSLKQLW